MDLLAYRIEAALGSPFVLTPAVVLFTLSVFFLAGRMMTLRLKKGLFAVGLICGVINGGLMCLLATAELGLSSYVLVLSLLLTVDLIILLKEEIFTYFFIFTILLFNYSSIFVVVSAFFQLGSLFTFSQKWTPVLLYTTLSCLLASAACFCLAFSERFPRKELRMVLRSWEKGKTIFLFSVISNFVVVANLMLFAPYIVQNNTGAFYKATFFSLFLRSASQIFGFCLLIVLNCMQEREKLNNMEIRRVLTKEKEFLDSLYKDAMFSYRVNIDKNCFIEGVDDLANHPDMKGGYSATMRIFAQRCIHPQDRDILTPLQNSTFFHAKFATEPSFRLRYRIDINRLMNFLHLPKGLKDQGVEADTEEEKWIWVEQHCALSEDISGSLYLFVALVDVNKEIEERKRMEKAANKDPLTGILNRGGWEEEVQKCCGENGLDHGALFLFDLDDFKEVNDCWGHPMGDRVLKEFSALLTDFFGEGQVVARLGGDEFAAFTGEIKDERQFEEKMAALYQQKKTCIPLRNGETMRISFSTGGALFPSQGADVATLYQRADMALYAAKRAGKSSGRLFTMEMLGDNELTSRAP